MEMGTIRIETSGSPIPRHWKVFLDGQEITRFVREVAITGKAGVAATVHLVLVGRVDLPDEIRARVTAEVVELESG